MKFKYLIAALFMGAALTNCDVDQTREAELPEVDVDVTTEAGQMPAFDVDWAEVETRMETRTIEVPKVRVVMEEETIEVPVIDVDWPDDAGEREERTFMVEADVDRDADLDIKSIFTNGNRIIVVAELDKDGDVLSDGEMMRVSDQVIVNSPDMDVRYYIVGDRPDGEFNRRYTYIKNMSDIKDMMKDGKVIYES
ncbi:hypothetical protein CEQ90_07905 [Lewinellaceae bacterium SD302]|nr:hypothetical protein CEQ90_07905 [Lewinellaceae bacterium SD302]